MKNLILTSIATLLVSTCIYAQTESGFGIKGGLNYNGNGDYFESATNSYQNPDRNLGYHIGVFAKVGTKVYFRPELVYTATKSDYIAGEFDLKKLDVPLLIGLKVLGPLHVFAGPSLQYIIDSDFENATINSIQDDFSVGLNFGIGVSFNKIGIDLRYERGFSDNEATLINNNISLVNNDRLDTRPDQLILSLSVML
ncbi:porin family protein [Olleya namhaensis]|uniref:Outer membrane protein beta-barrel domain-containing protein n=1 Tax=Olleya namhaensis TaxID=1144750 RepID=A0A1I3NTR8_9FLAO|nr:porin family protein [Olleya namhaensis]SFJ12547.1 Outer membrane protein beta-barrel domain-containing protein [Olleya namhaensis]